MIDPTGAGDVFAGTFAGVIHSGGEIDEALIQASALASISVEGFGINQLLQCSDDQLAYRVDFLKGTLDL